MSRLFDREQGQIGGSKELKWSTSFALVILIEQLEGRAVALFDETIVVGLNDREFDDDCAALAKGLLQDTLRQIPAR